MNESITATHCNAVAAEDAISPRNLGWKSLLIENEGPRRTDGYARTISIAQICINRDLAHDISPFCRRTAESLWR
jgi:hypothetical protein